MFKRIMGLIAVLLIVCLLPVISLAEDGKGTLELYRNGKVIGNYVGIIHNGQPHGKGTANYTDGDYYEGDWVNGKRHGYGYFQTKTKNTSSYQAVNGVVNFGSMLDPNYKQSEFVTVHKRGIWYNDYFLYEINLAGKQYDSSLVNQLASEYATAASELNNAIDALSNKEKELGIKKVKISGDILSTDPFYVWGRFAPYNSDDVNIIILNPRQSAMKPNDYYIEGEHYFLERRTATGRAGQPVPVYICGDAPETIVPYINKVSIASQQLKRVEEKIKQLK